MAVNDQAAFVLVRTRAAGNIGAAARALANMGFADLRLVAPDASWDRVATEMAAHGREVLRRSAVYPDLQAALHDCVMSIGTTCRPGLYRSGAQPLREAITEITQRDVEGRIALVFGPEDYGLSNDDLRYCQRLITIPTAPEYTSINLAQAVMLVAYELFIAGSPAAAQREPVLRESLTAPAPVPEIEMMLARMEQALVAIGFLPADNTERIMFALRGIFGRSRLNRRELDILNGIAHQVEWFAEGGREVIEAKHRSGRKIR
jgi:tRNA/rRNA methyltransferase